VIESEQRRLRELQQLGSSVPQETIQSMLVSLTAQQTQIAFVTSSLGITTDAKGARDDLKSKMETLNEEISEGEAHLKSNAASLMLARQKID